MTNHCVSTNLVSYLLTSNSMNQFQREGTPMLPQSITAQCRALRYPSPDLLRELLAFGRRHTWQQSSDADGNTTRSGVHGTPELVH